MPQATVPRARIADGSLPSVCVVCGDAAPHRRHANAAAPSFAWLFFVPILGLILSWASLLRDRGGEGGLPFCDRHERYWVRRARVIVFGFAILAALLVGMILTMPKEVPGQKGEPPVMGLLFAVGLLLYLPTFLYLHLTAVRPVRTTRTKLILAGANRTFVDALDESTN